MSHFDNYPELMPPEAADNKVSYEEIQDMPNAGKFMLYYEDHTLGNLIRMQLHQDPAVQFCGYRMPHPLYPRCEVKVQTTYESTPKDVFLTAVNDLIDQFKYMEDSFISQINLRRNNFGDN